MGKVAPEHTIQNAKLAQSGRKPPVIAFPDVCNDTGNDGSCKQSYLCIAIIDHVSQRISHFDGLENLIPGQNENGLKDPWNRMRKAQHRTGGLHADDELPLFGRFGAQIRSVSTIQESGQSIQYLCHTQVGHQSSLGVFDHSGSIEMSENWRGGDAHIYRCRKSNPPSRDIEGGVVDVEQINEKARKKEEKAKM